MIFQVNEIGSAHLTILQKFLGKKNKADTLRTGIALLKLCADAQARGDRVMIGNKEIIL